MDVDDAKNLQSFLRAKRKAEAKNKLNEVAEYCNCIGELYSKYGQYEEAIQEHTQELHLGEALGDKIGEAVACRKIGECHCFLGQYEEALSLQKRHLVLARGVGGTVACESALRSAGTLLLRVRALPSVPGPEGGPKSLKSSCCGLAIYKNPTL
ncbi:tonsoku-like protein [Plakobranchus ocellatus]|uniref:Tonsoku-like protein n=1 Tax=Plakobranchus ocellatus TaxID=259542 RepID=A0AAV3YCP6_9GAST|nr:tonsoku-like protein [Plakobranchus ocellatus]